MAVSRGTCTRSLFETPLPIMSTSDTCYSNPVGEWHRIQGSQNKNRKRNTAACLDCLTFRGPNKKQQAWAVAMPVLASFHWTDCVVFFWLPFSSSCTVYEASRTLNSANGVKHKNKNKKETTNTSMQPVAVGYRQPLARKAREDAALVSDRWPGLLVSFMASQAAAGRGPRKSLEVMRRRAMRWQAQRCFCSGRVSW